MSQILMAITGVILAFLSVTGAQPDLIIRSSWPYRLCRRARRSGSAPTDRATIDLRFALLADADVTRRGTDISWVSWDHGDRLEQLRDVAQEHRKIINFLLDLANSERAERTAADEALHVSIQQQAGRLGDLKEDVQRDKVGGVKLNAQVFPLVVLGAITGALAGLCLPSWFAYTWCVVSLTYAIPAAFIMWRRSA